MKFSRLLILCTLANIYNVDARNVFRTQVEKTTTNMFENRRNNVARNGRNRSRRFAVKQSQTRGQFQRLGRSRTFAEEDYANTNDTIESRRREADERRLANRATREERKFERRRIAEEQREQRRLRNVDTCPIRNSTAAAN